MPIFEIVQKERLLSRDEIEKALHKKNKVGNNHLTHYAYILHDKDTTSVGSPIEPHWHIIIKMDNACTTKDISTRFKVPTNLIDMPFDISLPEVFDYLTNNTTLARVSRKPLYDNASISSNFFNKIELVKLISSGIIREDNLEDFLSKDELRIYKKTINEALRDKALRLILSGVIRDFNYNDFVSKLITTKYEKFIKRAFSIRKNRLKTKRLFFERLNVVYVYGKDKEAPLEFAESFSIKNDFSYVELNPLSTVDDILNNYKEEDCLILKNINSPILGLDTLLDVFFKVPPTDIISEKNFSKLLECKHIFIIGDENIDSFTKKTSLSEGSIKTLIRVDDDKSYTSKYNEFLKDYEDEKVFKNF